MKKLNLAVSRIRIEHLWAIAIMVGIIAFLNTHPIRPHDFWWHMAVGRDIIENGQIPEVDTYSFTRSGNPYPSYQQFWLMEIALYLVYRAGGPVMIVLLQTLVVGSAYFLLLMDAWRSSQNWRAAALGLVFAFGLGFDNWNVRPQTASYLFGALILFAAGEYRRTRRPVWLFTFPVVMALWVNSHGSFPIGIGLVGLWLADEAWNVLLNRKKNHHWQFKQLIPASISFLLAGMGCLLNPNGIGFVRYLSSMAGNNIIQNFTPEWLPPDFNSLSGLIFFGSLIGSSVFLMLSPKRPNFYQVLTFVVFGLLGLKYVRGVIWFGIVMSIIIADHLDVVFTRARITASSSPTGRERQMNTLFVVVLALLAILSLPWFKPYWPVVPEKAGLVSAETPIEAANYIVEKGLPGNLFHDMPYGSYLIWYAYPKYQVFVDSRIELYPPEIWDDYFVIAGGLSNWEERLGLYSINTLLLSFENEPGLIEAAGNSENWSEVYQDEQAIIFVRQPDPSG